MAKTFRTLMKTVVAACCLGGVLAACHTALQWSGLPAAWTIPAGTAAALCWLALRAAIDCLHFHRDADDDGAASSDPLTMRDMRRAWAGGSLPRRKARRSLLGGRQAAAWYIAMRSPALGDDMFAGLSDFSTYGAGGEFAWHSGKLSLWLDAPFALDRDDGPWRTFLRVFRAKGGKTSLGGIGVFLDAGRLIATDAAVLKEDARLLRRRLETFKDICGEAAPVYLFVSRLDRLYGMRTLASGMDGDRLRRPLGGLLDGTSLGTAEFVRRTMANAIDETTAPRRVGDGELPFRRRPPGRRGDGQAEDSACPFLRTGVPQRNARLRQ